MESEKPVEVPEQNISSVNWSKWPGGLDLNEMQNVPANSFTSPTKDIQLDTNAYPTIRPVLTPFLPPTVETTYEKKAVKIDGETYYFTLDDGKAKWCQEGDSDWTDCDGADNDYITNNGGKPKLRRVLDQLLVLNGKNGNKLSQIDLTTTGFPVIKRAAVADPTVAPTAALTNLAAGAHNIYYAYTYSGNFGETLLSPILTQSINIVRDQWNNVPATPKSIELTRTGSIPTGATKWNAYIAVASTSGTIQDTDMLQLAMGLDLSTSKFVDDGTLDINLGGTAPIANSTDGMMVENGIVENGNPILFDDQEHPEAIYIGAGGPYALSFSVSDGGFKAEPAKGTDFRPTVLIGFRTGQGQPALTILYSNSEGISAQSTLEQKSVSYGNQSFTVWGVTEQHYGAAGVAATLSAINYNGKLLFLSTDGLMSMDTEASKQNVLSTQSISEKKIDRLIRGIKNSAMGNVVGTGWGNRFMWTIPNDGFDTPQQILVSDDNNGGSFYTYDISADWIGVVSPTDATAFVYISRGNKTYKVSEGDASYDVIDGVPVPFSTKATFGMMGLGSGEAHNVHQATVQVVFHVLNIVGTVTVGVNYIDQYGKPRTKTKTYSGPSFSPTSAGGYGDSGWSYGDLPSYGDAPALNPNSAAITPVDKFIKVRIDNVMKECQPFIYTGIGFNNWKLKSVSPEGINLGVTPDL